MKFGSRLAAFLLPLMLATAAGAADRAIIVLDASGSMWGQIGGEAKMTIARDTLRSVLGQVPGSLELGLIAYGHRDKGRCDDIELVVPPAPGTGPAIASAAAALSPKGKTPISDAVRIAAEDLRYTEEKATVILITDGIETCEADPCAVASALEAAGVDLTVHVVGFGLTEDEGTKVRCIADNTGGTYYSADNADGLASALSETVADAAAPAPEPAPAEEPAVTKNLRVTARPAPDAPPFTDTDGIAYDAYPVAADGSRAENAVDTVYGGDGSAGDFELPAGRYVIVARKDFAAGETTVDVTAGKRATADIVLDAGLLKARAMATETEPETSDGVAWDVTDAANRTDTGYGPTRTIWVNAGTVTVTARLGEARASTSATITAGAETDVALVLGAGKLVLRGKRNAETTEFDDNARFDVTGVDGQTATSYGQPAFDLPAGTYTVKATIGEASTELTVEVAAGRTTEQEVVIATGRLVAHALFAEGGPTVTASPRFDVLSPEPGPDGKRKVLATSYDDGVAFDLAPGKYVLRATSDVATAEAVIDLVAGPPMEVSVVLDAGLFALSAPGGDRLDVLSSKKDIYGKQASVATNYGETWMIALPAGDYTVTVRRTDGSEKSAPFTVKAGERTEVTVE